MMVDLYREGLEGDDALRRMDASSPLPQSATALVMVEDGGQAYRAVRGTSGGGVRIAPASDWGNGGIDPIFVYSNPSTGSIGRLVTIDGWRYPALLISVSGDRTDNTVLNPTLELTGRSSTGGVRRLSAFPFLAAVNDQTWILPHTPAMIDVALYVTTGDTLTNFGIAIHPLLPVFDKRSLMLDGYLARSRVQAVGTEEQVALFILPERYRVTLRLDVYSVPSNGSVTMSVIDRPLWTNNRVVSSNPVFGANSSAVLVIDELQYFDVRVSVNGTSGSAEYYLYARYERM